MTSVIPKRIARQDDQPMELLDDLRREHTLIETTLGSFLTWADLQARGAAATADRSAFLRFFIEYAGEFHHEREEDVLFPALAAHAGVRADSGPIAVLLGDHRRMAALLRTIGNEAEPAMILSLVRQYSEALWAHIDVDNSVLFPESELQLRRAGVRSLPYRSASGRERDLVLSAERLIGLYPPSAGDGIRGDGCAVCPAYGDACNGIEREWWNEWEWEELSDRVAAV